MQLLQQVTEPGNALFIFCGDLRQKLCPEIGVAILKISSDSERQDGHPIEDKKNMHRKIQCMFSF
jgi:hypothetical protein